VPKGLFDGSTALQEEQEEQQEEQATYQHGLTRGFFGYTSGI
jgi:hypothetical protein